MSKIFIFLKIFLVTCALHASLLAQKKDTVEISSKFSSEIVNSECKDLKLGRVVSTPKAIYPPQAKAARIGGTVFVTLKIDEKGGITEVEKVTGHELLQAAATEAARKIKFTPTACNGVAMQSSAVITYNFLPFIVSGKYFKPAKVEEFIDVRNDLPFYEAIFNLTENYKLAFGYADKKFYAEAPLTRGDFAHFLRSTLDLLSERAQTANKFPREIGLFYPYNSKKLTAITGIPDIKPNMPFYESLKTLLLKYDIALTNDKNEFQGNRSLTNNEVIELWSGIFGAEAIPINFGTIKDGDRIISRGEFALFLQESLQVLTYKVLP